MDPSSKSSIVMLDDEGKDDGKFDASKNLKTNYVEKKGQRPKSSDVEEDHVSSDHRYLEKVRRASGE